MQKVYSWACQIGNLGLWIIWLLIHFAVDLWYFALHIACAIESYLISSGILKRYKALDIDKLRYLAIVIESEEAYHIPAVIQLLQWLEDIGVKHVCLYDAEARCYHIIICKLLVDVGILKKSKESILGKLNNAILFEEDGESNLLLDCKHITLEFASFPDGKEAVAKAANLLFMKYVKLGGSGKIQEEKIFTEAHMSEALRAVGCKGPEPDLLLVYGPTYGTLEIHEVRFPIKSHLQVHNGAPKLWELIRFCVCVKHPLGGCELHSRASQIRA
ncbi:Ditrans,polycis-polyprenyl diphosphate synthase ((2E,6E)-farnesyldiphosphate specific) [Citrus sinensis]|nr:Ditrans,polycis-polyprenyl diphosphate synthase ((2E,6E)-farnesyldiphosphate specific) [Citrus sinensis]